MLEQEIRSVASRNDVHYTKWGSGSLVYRNGQMNSFKGTRILLSLTNFLVLIVTEPSKDELKSSFLPLPRAQIDQDFTVLILRED